jgi:hypothetical protein
MKKLINTIITAIISILLVTPLSSCYSSVNNKRYSKEKITYTLNDGGRQIINESFNGDADKFLEQYYISPFIHAGIFFNSDGTIVIQDRGVENIQGTYTDKVNSVNVEITHVEKSEFLLGKTITFHKNIDKLTLDLMSSDENLSQYFKKIIVTYKRYTLPF